jgi:MOSC domain-containing protein YiiM
MPTEGVFARVLASGQVRAGDTVELIGDGNDEGRDSDRQ